MIEPLMVAGNGPTLNSQPASINFFSFGGTCFGTSHFLLSGLEFGTCRSTSRRRRQAVGETRPLVKRLHFEIGKTVRLRHLFLQMAAPQEVQIAPQRGRGVIARYREFLPVSPTTPVISLGEGGTPLIFSARLSAVVGRGCEVYLKYEGLNPTCSFKDRGMICRGFQGRRPGRRRGDLRFDRQYFGFRGRVRRARGDSLRRHLARRQDRER